MAITAQLARSALLYKQANIAHCDFKDENVMFNPFTGVVKIIDFGNACHIDKVKAESFAPPAYYSPELKKLESIEPTADLLDQWSSSNDEDNTIAEDPLNADLKNFT